MSNQCHAQKTVVISGGGRGLGKAVALAFAKEQYNVCLFSRNLSECQETVNTIISNGGHGRAWQGDVSRSGDVQRIFREVVELYGRIDVVVNNAGMTVRKPFSEHLDEEIDQMIATNIKGTIYCCREAAKYMMRMGGGTIINVASVGAFIGLKNRVVYSSTKAAIVSLTKGLALELAPYGITVNAVAPGAIATPLNEKWFLENPEVVEELKQNIPLGRIAKPEDIEGAILFLASSSASYINGHTLVIDGGWTVS